ncbi:MAG: hypothetical protein L6Q35_00630 [Phycisphaerales bacterium]|nr:hypothetical protein [Phycisphaerales bacterium]
MANVWPVSLPTAMRIRDLNGAFGAGMIRTQMDAGPAKQRPRFTAAPAPYSGSMLMSGTQLQTLLSFYRTTLVMGADSFEWTDPLTGSAAMVRMTAPPRVTSLAPLAGGDEQWQVNLDIEVLPDAVSPAVPGDQAAAHPEYFEWGPWYHAFDASPAGEVDPAFAGTDAAALGSNQDGGGGMDPHLVFASMGGAPGHNGADVIVPA